MLPLTCAEHYVLYQVNINKAENVFIGLQQGEAAYWQGNGSTLLAPEPWTGTLLPSDPDFDWCAADDAEVRVDSQGTVVAVCTC